VKIIKGSLRFGTWVNIMDHGGWRWKHWGCVSGNQLESVRNSAATGDGYDWDTIDGYDEMG
jgi:serine/threonine-protein kinase ATR